MSPVPLQPGTGYNGRISFFNATRVFFGSLSFHCYPFVVHVPRPAFLLAGRFSGKQFVVFLLCFIRDTHPPYIASEVTYALPRQFTSAFHFFST